MSIYESLGPHMQKVSDEVMEHVMRHFEPSISIAQRVHWHHLKTTLVKQTHDERRFVEKHSLEPQRYSDQNQIICGVWGGNSFYQSLFDFIWKNYVPQYGEPENNTQSVMLVYALGKIEHEYYNNGFGNLDLYDNSCPMYSRHEFSWDYWEMLQFLYSVSPSVREVLLILKRRRERFQCEMDECYDE